MDATEAIRRMCDQSGRGVVEVSQELGKSKMYVSGMISRHTVPRTDTLAQIAQTCGYRLILESDTDKIVISTE